jgi:hypothetical protein
VVVNVLRTIESHVLLIGLVFAVVGCTSDRPTEADISVGCPELSDRLVGVTEDCVRKRLPWRVVLPNDELGPPHFVLDLVDNNVTLFVDYRETSFGEAQLIVTTPPEDADLPIAGGGVPEKEIEYDGVTIELSDAAVQGREFEFTIDNIQYLLVFFDRSADDDPELTRIAKDMINSQ